MRLDLNETTRVLSSGVSSLKPERSQRTFECTEHLSHLPPDDLCDNREHGYIMVMQNVTNVATHVKIMLMKHHILRHMQVVEDLRSIEIALVFLST